MYGNGNGKMAFFRLKMSLTMNLFGVHLWYFSGSCYRMNTFSRQRERERRKQSNANCTEINREKNHDTKFQKRFRNRWITEQLFFWFFNLYEFRLSIRYYVKRGSWPLFWHLKKIIKGYRMHSCMLPNIRYYWVHFMFVEIRLLKTVEAWIWTFFVCY